MNKKMSALSFFSGAMGLDLGLEKAGVEVLLASEIDPAACKTIKKNKPKIPLIGDIRDFSSNDILKMAGINDGEKVDLIVGGPPCQAFSTAGKRKGFEDERGNVFLKYIDLITEIRPRYAVIENVRGLLSAPLKHRPHESRGAGHPPLSPEEQRGGALFVVLRRLSKAGYKISFNLYNSANFGSPQSRERVIIVCSREGRELPYLVPTHSKDGSYNLPKWKTFREAVKGLSNIKHNHVSFPEKRLKYYRLLGPGENWRNLPEKLQKEAMGNAFYSGGGKTGFLRRIAWDQPSPTLVTYPAMPATDLAHPELDRPLSVEEYKRVQEFPDDWEIMGSIRDQYRQIGNAVPVSLGYAIGRLLVDTDAAQLHSRKFLDFPYSRYKNCDHITWLKRFEGTDEQYKFAV